MTALGEDAPNVVGLVYFAAFGLDEGESIGALLGTGEGLDRLHMPQHRCFLIITCQREELIRPFFSEAAILWKLFANHPQHEGED